MTVQRTLYRQLLVALRKMRVQGLPCTGCVGLPATARTLCPTHHLASAFRSSSSSSSSSTSLNDAFHALRVLPKQLLVLQAAEDETRQALRQWQALQQAWCHRSPLSPALQVEAAEAAAWLLQRLVTKQQQQQLLLDEEIEELQQTSEAGIAAAQQQLNELAVAVRAAVPDAFNDQQQDLSQRQALEQLEVLSKVLFQTIKLRCDPFEWVYDGLDPLLLPEVLEKRKGTPLAVALVTAAVGRRLCMPLQLVCAQDTQMPGTESGPLLIHQLPPEIAARQAGRTLATAPSPDTWLVQLMQQPTQGQSWTAQGNVFLDVTQKGKLLAAAACQERYPGIGSILQQQQQQQQPWRQQQQPSHNKQAESRGQLSVVSGSAIVQVWSSMARTMVLAHQRRGESDLVAHWLYQLLALDSQAAEWKHALQQ